MALTLESQGRVRQKAREFIKQPGIFYTLKAVFLYLSIYKKEADLQLVVLNPATLTAAGGQVVADVPARVYVLWGKKQDTALASYLQLHNAAVTDSIATMRAFQSFQTAEEDAILFSPTGVEFTTAISAGAMTGPGVTTESAAVDAPNGFVILGAL